MTVDKQRSILHKEMVQLLNHQPTHTRDISLSLLDDDEMEHGEIGVDDAASDAPAVALARAARTIAFVLSAEKQTNSPVRQHALHHRET